MDSITALQLFLSVTLLLKTAEGAETAASIALFAFIANSAVHINRNYFFIRQGNQSTRAPMQHSLPDSLGKWSYFWMIGDIVKLDFELDVLWVTARTLGGCGTIFAGFVRLAHLKGLCFGADGQLLRRIARDRDFCMEQSFSCYRFAKFFIAEVDAHDQGIIGHLPILVIDHAGHEGFVLGWGVLGNAKKHQNQQQQQGSFGQSMFHISLMYIGNRFRRN